MSEPENTLVSLAGHSELQSSPAWAALERWTGK
jgi:hypothetical protein